MSRGMPYSIVIHLMVLTIIIFFGNSVARQEIRPPRSIRVRMVELPRVQENLEEPEAETPPQVIEPEPKTEPPPELPPKEVPQEKPKPEKPLEPKKESVPRTEDLSVEKSVAEEPAEDEGETDPVPVVTGPAVEGTDVDFPFAWYLAQVQGQIARNWNPSQLGFRAQSVVSCTVHFTINKSGNVSQITLTRPSGVGVFDREALRVVQSSRIPPLPGGFSSPTLGISMKFNLESGI